MCIIIWSPTGRIPREQVEAAMERHPDGWGFSVVTSGGIRTFRSTIRYKFILAWFNRVRGPVLFHARWATHGNVCRDNCHPFMLKNHDIVVAHNGVLSGYGGKDKSDTRDFIERVVEPLPAGFFDDQEVIDALELHIGGGNKVVMLDKDGNTVILNEHLGVWVGDTWYSNRTIDVHA